MAKKSADWLAWSLQFIGGGIVAAIGTFILIFQNSSAILNPPLLFPILILGASLLGGGLASYCGDRLWIGDSYRVIPPDDLRHSPMSRTLSITTALVGITFILLVLIRNIGLL